MQEHFHFTTDRVKLQKQYASILLFVSAQLSSIQIHLQRRNRHLLKQEDEVIITVYVLGKLLGFTSERAWHRFVIGNLFSKDLFPERSRYNRRCRALGFAIKWMRHRLAKRRQHHAYAVVDSLPIELCHSARMHRAKRFCGIADIGYRASKKIACYGLKLHLQVTATKDF
jgi:hypothetical protein